MKMLLRVVVPLFALFVLVPSSGAAAPGQDHVGGWLGLMLADRSASTRGGDATEASPQSEGVLIRGVVEGSPADQVRLRAKDSIVAIDGAAVSGAAELIARVSQMDPGSIATLSVRRAGHDLELSPVLGTRPDNSQRVKMVRGWLGVEAIELPASLRAHFGAPDDAGVLVSNVVDGSPADDAGIRVGDVIYEADGQAVKSVGVLLELVSEAGVENAIDVVLARDGARIVVGPRIARAPEPPQS